MIRSILTIMLTSLMAVALAQGVGGQIVKTWDFEDKSLGNWAAANGDGKLVLDSTTVLSGKYSVALTAEGVANSAFANDVYDNIYPGDIVTYRVYVPAASIPMINGLQPFFQDGGWSWKDKWVSGSGLKPDAWQEITYEFPEDMKGVNRFGLQITGFSKDESPVIYLDNVTIRSTTSLKWDFEGKALGQWAAANGDGKLTLDSTFVLNGKYSAKLAAEGVANAAFANDVFEGFVDGDIITYHVYVPAASIPMINGLQPFFQDGGWSWKDKWVSGSSLTPDAWNTITYEMPEGFSGVNRVGLQITGFSKDETPVIYLDDITVSNLSLRNYWNFENKSFDNWMMANGDGVLTLDSTNMKGKYSAKVAAEGVANAPFANDVFDAIEGGDIITFEVYVPAASIPMINGLQPFFQDAGWGWHDKWVSASSLQGDAWNKIVYQFPVDMNGVNRFGLQITGFSKDETPVIYIDNIRLDASLAVRVNKITLSAAGGANIIDTDDGTLQLSALVEPDTAENKVVTWSISNTEGEAMIDQTGLVTAYDNGKVIAYAKSTDGSDIVGSYEITISNQSITAESVKIHTADDLLSISSVGATLQLWGEVLPDKNAVLDSVLWSVSNAVVATIDTHGVLTAVANGNVTITATSYYYPELSETVDVTVAVVAQSIALSAPSTSIAESEGTLQISATVTPAQAVDASVSWRVYNETGMASIDENGLLTAMKNGKVGVYAIANDASQLWSDTLYVNISGQYVAVTSVTVTASKYAVAPFETLQMTAKVMPTDATVKNVSWSVENRSGEATISEDGLLTAVSSGTVVVIATSADDSGVFPGEVEVTVTESTVLGNDQLAPFAVYPNPATHLIKINGSVSLIQLYTMDGRLLKEITDTNEMNVSDLNGGSYLLRIHTSDQVLSSIILKK